MNKKVLLTGANGFLARSFYQQYYSEYNITRVSRKELDLNNSDAVYDILKSCQFDVVIHGATYDAAPMNSPKDPALVLENNLRMFFNLTRCSNFYGKMLYFGSGAEFSRPFWKPRMKEDYFDQNVPKDQYGLSKYVMTKYTLKNENIYNLRLFGVHGEQDDWRYRFISNACCHAVFNMPISIHQNAVFDFLYINDLVKIVQWFIDNEPQHKVYNVCSGKTYDYISLARKINDISLKNLDPVIEKEGCRAEYSGDNSLLLSELGSFDFIPMDESLQAMYRWYEKHKNQIDPGKFHY